MKIVNFWAPRGKIGKSRILVNLAYDLATHGKKIGIFDSWLGSNSCFNHFAQFLDTPKFHFEDFLTGICDLDDVLLIPKEVLSPGEDLFIFPIKSSLEQVLRDLKDKPENEINFLRDALLKIGCSYKLDYLFINGVPGFGREALVQCLLSELIYCVFCPHVPDYEGIYLIKAVLEKFAKNEHFFVLNQVISNYEQKNIQDEFGKVFPGKKVVGFFPFIEKQENLYNMFGFSTEPDKKFSVEISELAKFF
ncbi:hypothetical protein ACFL35_07655 [Candidatus Riflebacteria bacterium]